MTVSGRIQIWPLYFRRPEWTERHTCTAYVTVNMQDLTNTTGPALCLPSVYRCNTEPSVQTVAPFTGAAIPEPAVSVNTLPPAPLCS